MKKRLAVVAVIAAIAATSASGAATAKACDRACRIAAANTYLAALVSHDGSQVPAAKDVNRVENGGDSADGADDLRAGLEAPIMYVITGIRDLHWYVDGPNAVSTYLLDTVSSPTYIVERFRIGDDGLIRDIRANFFIDIPGYVQGPESVPSRADGVVERFTAASHGPLGPVPVSEGDAGDDAARNASACGRTCVSAAADRWLRALSSHAGASVPLTRDAVLRVNRRTVAAGEAAARATIASPNGIAQVREVEVAVDGDHAVAMYTLRTKGGDDIHGAVHLRVVGGRIASADAVCDANETCTG